MCVPMILFSFLLTATPAVNHFAGTHLEELKGEIPQLCKDQHGCRYLQKKLEESVPEHRDMIFVVRSAESSVEKDDRNNCEMFTR